MMPGMNGIEVLTKLRLKGITVPALFLTAKGEIEDRITGLDAGGDDYLAKPFDTGELLARIKAMLRRRENYTPDILSFGDISLDPALSELKTALGTVRLGNKEYQVMEMLMMNPGQLLPAELFLERVWGFDNESETNVLWVSISNIRKKLQASGSRVRIVALRNLGYKLEDGK
jgi:DNA-binding response OmpR family regulator